MSTVIRLNHAPGARTKVTMAHWIYLVTNLVNGRRYVGQSVKPQARWSHHRHLAARGGGWPLHAAIRKHGVDSFSFQLVEQCTDQAHADRRERFWIRHYGTRIEHAGYNLTDGGGGLSGVARDASTRAKIGAAHRGRKATPETRARISAARQRMSPEQREKYAAAARGNHIWLGKKHSEASRAKMSESQKALPPRVQTDSERAKRAETMRQFWADRPELREATDESLKRAWANPARRAAMSEFKRAWWAARRAAKTSG